MIVRISLPRAYHIYIMVVRCLQMMQERYQIATRSCFGAITTNRKCVNENLVPGNMIFLFLHMDAMPRGVAKDAYLRAT